MIKISFEINGKKINPNQIGDAIEKAAFKQLQASIIKMVGSVHCKTHGNSPAITVKGRSIDKLSFSVSGCCEALIKQVQEKLSNKN